MEREEVGVGERFEFLYRRGVGRGGGGYAWAIYLQQLFLVTLAT